MTRTWVRVVRWLLLAVHAVLVVPAVVFWLEVAAPATHDSPDGNIGAGLVGLYLLFLGLPWSLITMWVEPNDVAFAVFPMISLVLHAAGVWRAVSRGRRVGDALQV
ncbi:hypothetical protein ACQPZJ_04815 [Actinoplanes sp. CA-054009]